MSERLSKEMYKHLKGERMNRFEAAQLADELVRKGLETPFAAEMIRRTACDDHH